MTNAQGNRGWAAVMVAAILMMLAGAIAAPAQTVGTPFTTLFSFDGTDGSGPSGIVQGTDGNLYGTAGTGGAYGFGTVFKMTPRGTVTVLYSFCSQSDCSDGSYPISKMVQGTDGSFYGMTESGGTENSGTIFKITPSGTLTTLYRFCSRSGCSDGEFPDGGLVQGTDGSFYGTTINGGSAGYGGTIFKITPKGSLTTLYSFCPESGCTSAGGTNPYAGLVLATDGNFYGTTAFGGPAGYGTVFRITPEAVLTTLYTFCSQTGCSDGSFAYAGLVEGADGSFYGTTLYGGAGYSCGSGPFSGCGTVYQLTSNGTFTTIYSFCPQGNCENGYSPNRLFEATDANLYDTTGYGGSNDHGTAFRITPGGALTTLYAFNGTTDGEFGQIWTEGTAGKIYGTMGAGGSDVCEGGCGTVFGLSVGLGPFVEAQPTFGRVGSPIKILGTNLAGATSATFNGTPAVFKVISGSLIGATVPFGATTGRVQVVTPSGTLTSNVNFRVLP